MNQNGLRIRNLFELAQKSDKQTVLNARAEFPLLRVKLKLTVTISSSPEVRVYSYFAWRSDDAIFNFYGKRDSNRVELENYEPKTVEFQIENSATKRRILLHENPGALGKYGCAFESMEEFLDFAVYIQNLFDAPVYTLDIAADQAQHLPRILSVEEFRRSEIVKISVGTLSNEEMRQVLKFPEIVVMRCTAEPDFELQEPISMKVFQTKCDHWFKAPMFMQLACKEVHIHSLELQNAQINAFLHYWMSNTDRKFEKIVIEKKCREIERSDEYGNNWEVKKNWEEEKFDMLRITEGLTRCEKPKHLADLENVQFFRRKIDGMVMNVEVHNNREGMSLCFLQVLSTGSRCST